MDRDAHVDAAAEAHRDELQELDALIRETLPGAAPGVGHGMLGSGPVHDRDASGRESDAFLVSVAARRAGVSLPGFSAGEGGRYLAERGAERLENVDVGESCVRFERVGDLGVDAPRGVPAGAGRLGAPATI